MTTEELLKPRYKVIAGYPLCIHEIGTVLVVADYNLAKQPVFDLINLLLNDDAMNRYPHLFRKLEWWEERKVEDMPGYVKDYKGGLWKPDKWFFVGDDMRFHTDTPWMTKSASDCSIATETEYLTYINDKQ